MNLRSLVDFARQIGRDGNTADPSVRSPDDIDIPIEGRARPPVFLDLVDRPRVPTWIDQAGPAADGVIIEEGVEAPPRPTVSGELSPDVLAFYRPYHFHAEGRWGIYILESGIATVAAAIDPATWPPTQETVDIAWSVLVDHERFHCLAETAVTRGETMVLDGLYRGYFHDRHVSLHEEAMANAYAYRMLKKSKKGFLPEITTLLLSGGYGYDQFEAYVPGHAFGRGEDLLAGQALAHDRRYGLRLTRPSGSLRYLFQPVRLGQIPIRPVSDLGGWLSPVRKFPSWGGVQADAHVDDHPPVHFHVRIPADSRPFRLTWPDLTPTGIPQRELSNKDRKALNAYLSRHGDGIRRRLEVAYGVELGQPATRT